MHYVFPKTVDLLDLPLGQQALMGGSGQQALIDRRQLLVSCPSGVRMGVGIGVAEYSACSTAPLFSRIQCQTICSHPMFIPKFHTYHMLLNMALHSSSSTPAQ